GEAARVEVDVEENETGLDASHVQGLEPEREDPLSPAALPDRVPDPDRVVGRSPDLEPEIARVPGPRDRHRHAGDLRARQAEVRQIGDGRSERGEKAPRSWALDRQDAVVGRNVLDPDVQPAA